MKLVVRVLPFVVFVLFFVRVGFTQNLQLQVERSERSGGSYIYEYQNSAVGNSWQKKIEPAPIIPPSSFGFESLPLMSSLVTINFNEEGIASDYYHIPPDPMAAIGPEHIVNVVNITIEWYTRSGTRQFRQNLRDFFSVFGDDLEPFDPKVIFDHYENRFVLVVFERHTLPKRSQILLAVSQDSDPNNGWYYFQIDAQETIGVYNTWVDYPGIAVDEEAVYITGNMFPFTNLGLQKGARLWIIDKGVNTNGFYAGGTPVWNKYDPYSEVGAPNDYTTTMPAYIFGAPSNFGTFLVSYSGLHDINNLEYLSVIRVDNPLSSPTFTRTIIPCGNIDNTSTGLPDAPQKDSDKLISTNDRRTLNAVWRDNFLYTVASLLPGAGPNAGQTTAHWFQINTSDLNNLTLYDQGDIGGEDIAPGCFTFFPSIMVDKHGNIGIGFSASAPSIYPGAYYTGRRPNDTAGTVQPSQVFKPGIDYYYRTFGHSQNRWGDYTSIALDPTDEETFWIYNEYALDRGTVLPSYPSEDGRWGTAVGSFSFQAYANIKIFMEGPYSGGTMSTDLNTGGFLPLNQPYTTVPWSYSGDESVSSIPENVVDWVLVEVRSDVEASSRVARRAGFLLNTGQIVDLDGTSYLHFPGLLPGDYYVVIRHRNHLDVMTASPTTLWAQPAIYDFTSTDTKFYGNAAKHLDNGVYGMYAGDADGNGQVQTSDKNDYWWPQSGTAGYKSGDFDLNGQVQTSDKNDYWWNNSGVGSAVPE